MKNTFVVLLITGLVVVSSGAVRADPDTVTQVSTIDAILAGAYDGQMTLKELKTHGDFGIGTFHGLDGEMILLDGSFYQVKATGAVVKPDAGVSTPFAAVVDFSPDISFPIDGKLDLEGLKSLLDQKAPGENTFSAVKVHGTFSRIKTRSVPAQTKPYPPLTEVTKHQPVFERAGLTGTLVGLRAPAYVKGINVPGYHFHFLSDDHGAGGHVLGFSLENGTAEIDTCNRFLLILPREDEAFQEINLGVDRTKELHEAETDDH